MKPLSKCFVSYPSGETQAEKALLPSDQSLFS
jgi:hypothetical protein